MKTKNLIVLFLICVLSVVLSSFLLNYSDFIEFALVMLFLSCVLGITFFVLLLTKLIKCLPNNTINFNCLFSIIAFIVSVALFGYGFYDMKTDSSFLLPGFVGWLIMVFIAPIPLILSLISIVKMFIDRKKKR